MKPAIDVYNDSKILTLSANSWSAWSLAVSHAEKQVSSIKDNGNDSPFVPFEPSSVELHYKDPNHYAEMLSITAELEIEKL